MTRKIKVAPLMALVMATVAMAGCDSDPTGVAERFDPRDLEAAYTWVFLEQWDEAAALGYPAVELTWEVPASFGDEVFRIYARRAGGSYGLIATVTSCRSAVCTYLDTNVAGGRSYDYYVATVDERDGTEVGLSDAVAVDVPERPALTTPGAAAAVALDGAAYLEWDATGAARYIVLAQPEGEGIFLIGETDGTSYYDDRAANGVRYSYYLAAVDGAGHVSALSQSARVIPRPDFHADFVYAHADDPAASGFRFVSHEDDDPIVAGDSPDAQWRLEEVNGELRIRPLGQTVIDSGTFTTELTCGPGSDVSCVDVEVAPTAGFASTAVPATTGMTYVLRVRGSDGQQHYAKLRVQGQTQDSQGRRLVVFDWAYQLRADEPSLNVM
ncbi:MAG: hypothetical protein WD737_10635 [Gemmatimonadota bacterium]